MHLSLCRIETVAAGGGSIIDFQRWQVLVGPTKCRADPGPACYGKGGPYDHRFKFVVESSGRRSDESTNIQKHAMIRFE
ncbi:MAG: hypothetical protein IPG82_10405 [Saprospiraceae bacterium]|nr:hypothetical protein [Saprospiraceae bacterium]